ncbi:MAG TPA: class I SAM-dependent methyltransferase [Acidimicrobiales bacterium]|nr:class I SAM-dependent methyltransferase [Acidimicrobiales bacterium]
MNWRAGSLGGLPLNSVCHPMYWDDAEWRTYGRALGIPQEEGWIHRKAWEWTQCVYGLERLGALGPGKRALGVGAGHERVLYYLANRTASTVATDLYAGDFATSPAEEADRHFLCEPERFAPFKYYQDHLLALPADGCALPFRSATFDVVYSLSSIEHFGGHERAAVAMGEMSRVLRPGGVACVATELVLEGGAHPAYFCPEDLSRYVLKAPGLVLVEPLSSRRPPAEMMEDPVKLPDELMRTPHVVLQDGPWKFTSVCLFFVKPTATELAVAAGRRFLDWLPRRWGHRSQERHEQQP